MARDTLEALDVPGNTITAAAERVRPSALLLRLAEHTHAARLEKAHIELRAQLGRIPSARETWLEFEARHPLAAEQVVASALSTSDGEAPA